MEHIDHWHRSHSAPPPIVQTNILEAIHIQPHDPEASQSFPSLHIMSHFNTTVEEERELQILNTVMMAAFKHKEEIQNHNKPATKPKNNPVPNKPNLTMMNPNLNIKSHLGQQHQSAAPAPSIPKPLTPSVPPMPPVPSQLQYCYLTPIEDLALTQNIIQCSLNTLISITLRELYAMAPEAHKYVRDQLTT